MGRVTSLPVNMNGIGNSGPFVISPHVQHGDMGSFVHQHQQQAPVMQPSLQGSYTSVQPSSQVVGYSNAHLQHAQQVSEWSQRAYRGSGSGILGGHLSQLVPLNIEVYEPDLDAKGNPVRIPV